MERLLRPLGAGHPPTYSVIIVKSGSLAARRFPFSGGLHPVQWPLWLVPAQTLSSSSRWPLRYQRTNWPFGCGRLWEGCLRQHLHRNSLLLFLLLLTCVRSTWPWLLVCPLPWLVCLIVLVCPPFLSLFVSASSSITDLILGLPVASLGKGSSSGVVLHSVGLSAEV